MNDDDRLPYLPWLDGLRAVAVSAVLLFHHWQFVPFDERRVRGGFLGVDVFFAVSGFLITALLLIERKRSGRIGLAAFWLRRSRRLLPALLVMLLGVAALAQWVFTARERAELRGDALSALFYVENWYHARHGITAVGHTWSLAIEEQWYLLWPIIVVGLCRAFGLRLQAMAVAVAAMAVGSLVWAASFSDADIDRVYHGTDTRAHSLLVGSVLGVVFVARRSVPVGRWSRAIDAAGVMAFVVLLIQFWMMSTQTDWLFRGGITITAVTTAAIITAGIWGAGVVRAMLGVAPLRAIGVVSYGLYLYHWPIYWWLRAGRVDLDGARLFALRLVVTAVVALASYWLVERPIRRGAFAGYRFGILMIPAVAITAVAIVLATNVDLSDADDVRSQYERYAVGHLDDRRVLIVGDASAAPLTAAGPSLSSGSFVSAISTPCDLMGGIVLVDEVRIPSDPDCFAPLPRFEAAIEGFGPDVVVIMVGATAGLDREVGGAVLRYSSAELEAHLDRRFDALLETVSARGRDVVVLGAPCNLLPGEENAARSEWLRGVTTRWAESRDVSVLDLASFQCPAGVPATTPSGPMFGPDGMTEAGADATIGWIASMTGA